MVCFFLFWFSILKTQLSSSNQPENYMIVFVFHSAITWLCQICHTININGDRVPITYVCTQTFVCKHCTIIPWCKACNHHELCVSFKLLWYCSKSTKFLKYVHNITSFLPTLCFPILAIDLINIVLYYTILLFIRNIIFDLNCTGLLQSMYSLYQFDLKNHLDNIAIHNTWEDYFQSSESGKCIWTIKSNCNKKHLIMTLNFFVSIYQLRYKCVCHSHERR